jgi:uncharacterized protein YdeI (YjbR/CyaY-like superfamily)
VASRKAAGRKSAAGKKPPKRAVRAKSAGRTEPKPIRAFRTQRELEVWLARNHGRAEGVWIRFAKKASGIKSVTHPEALETALCFGWIDALRLPESETTYLQRFLPRRQKSLWSKINRAKAVSLIESGRMQAPGLAEVERAKQDGRWEAAYDSPANAKMPDDFQRELDRNPKARAFFDTISRVNRYAIIWRLATAKTQERRDTLSRRFLEMLEKGETLH